MAEQQLFQTKCNTWSNISNEYYNFVGDEEQREMSLSMNNVKKLEKIYDLRKRRINHVIH